MGTHPLVKQIKMVAPAKVTWHQMSSQSMHLHMGPWQAQLHTTGCEQWQEMRVPPGLAAMFSRALAPMRVLVPKLVTAWCGPSLPSHGLSFNELSHIPVVSS